MNNYSHFIAITNRHLCPTGRSFEEQITRIAALGVKAIVLREKDLNEEEYISLAENVSSICKEYSTPLIIHNNPNAIEAVDSPYLHLPLSKLQSLSNHEFNYLTTVCKKIGTSIHSVDDAKNAYTLGASYLFAGNIYETECKKGLPGRGLHFLHDVCKAVPIPVYAIGGINENRLVPVIQAGAAGACMMSGFMQI